MSPPRSDRRPIISLSTVAAGERAAAAAIAAQIAADGFTVLFCTTHYDLGRLGRALKVLGRTRVVAATTGAVVAVATTAIVVKAAAAAATTVINLV